jgi:hypothetical protein
LRERDHEPTFDRSAVHGRLTGGGAHFPFSFGPSRGSRATNAAAARPTSGCGHEGRARHGGVERPRRGKRQRQAPASRARHDTAPELGSENQRTTSTNLDGRYEFKNLPAARYRVSVTRGGYLPLDHGQRRPGELGRPVQIAEGQTLDKIDFALPRMSTISGRVTDESGDAIEGVRIFATRSMFFEGRRRLVPVGSGNLQTDEEGEYRIARLAPGTYYVMATTKETWTVTENGQDRLIGYVPTYFPGVTNSAEARRITLAVGQHIGAMDFALVPGRAAKVAGSAVDSRGKPFARVSLSEEVRGLGFASFGGGLKLVTPQQ